jgi:hypothetical protein
MVNYAMNVLDVQRKHSKTELLVEGAELAAVNETGSKSKLVLLTQFMGVFLHTNFSG